MKPSTITRIALAIKLMLLQVTRSSSGPSKYDSHQKRCYGSDVKPKRGDK